MLHKLHYKNELIELSDRNYVKLNALLPYWGLTINRGQIKEKYPEQMITCNGLPSESIELLQEYLDHTGVTLESARNVTHADFNVSFHSQQKHPIIIHYHHNTYMLKPMVAKPADTNKLIHKNLWLPAHTPPFDIGIKHSYKKHASEWLAHLILIYLNPTNDEGLPPISLTLFQQLIHECLMPINPKFAALYKTDHEPDLSWPALPTQEKESHHHKAQPITPTDEEPAEPIQATLYDQDQESPEPMTGSPFLKQKDNQIHTTFNPFKGKKITHEDPVMFNPFKNKR